MIQQTLSLFIAINILMVNADPVQQRPTLRGVTIRVSKLSKEFLLIQTIILFIRVVHLSKKIMANLKDLFPI